MPGELAGGGQCSVVHELRLIEYEYEYELARTAVATLEVFGWQAALAVKAVGYWELRCAHDWCGDANGIGMPFYANVEQLSSALSSAALAAVKAVGYWELRCAHEWCGDANGIGMPFYATR